MTDSNPNSAQLCPICGGGANVLRRMEFPQRRLLPSSVNLCVCQACDFGFTLPRPANAYKDYYCNHVNDQLGINWVANDSEVKRYSQQISFLKDLLEITTGLQILDFGCGQGGLLTTMAKEYPQHIYFGVDAHALTNQDTHIKFSTSLSETTGEFDLVIISHVLEHLVDFEILGDICNILRPNGSIYIEIPDASAYGLYPQREFLYYFDRLHVNHFTLRSLEELAARYSFSIIRSGAYVFDYKDGSLFPALFSMFKKGASNTSMHRPLDLSLSFMSYTNSEYSKLTSIHRRLAGSRATVAYGFGDNFFRLFGDDGPLSDVTLKAVVDRRFEQLVATKYAERYRFLEISKAIQEFKEALWVVTVSWGAEEIVNQLRECGIPKQSILSL